MRRSAFPPKLREFVDAVEEKARAVGHRSSTARVYGAWVACFVRFCTLYERSWREPEHVPAFLEYLEQRLGVDESSRERSTEAMAFLFGTLLKTDVSDADWHPSHRLETNGTDTEAQATSEKGEQSTLLTRLLFHTSLPINEALDLCAGDVDLDAGLIYVSDPMGTPKRIVEIPEALFDPLRRHLRRLRRKHGPQYFDASLFQARALHGQVDENASDSQTTPVGTDDDTGSSDQPSSLWEYAGED